MKSGLEDRNNCARHEHLGVGGTVSMKSGLEDRNNDPAVFHRHRHRSMVSMKSGLEDRNNLLSPLRNVVGRNRLNEVRPGRPEQFETGRRIPNIHELVSMKSGLEDRNNGEGHQVDGRPYWCLNEVRPGRPEQ